MPRSSGPRPGALFAAIAAASLLAGCRVDVNGAPCTMPGFATDCPDGQACGNDLRCSARALACAESRCSPGESHCSAELPNTAIRCDDAADPVCGRWVQDDCGAREMECPGVHGSDGCECPVYIGTTIVADRRGSPSASARPFPTGKPEPPECRFGRLGDALAAASSLAPTAAIVEIDGAAGDPVVFGTTTGEDWPLFVATNVTVLAAPPPAGPTVIRGGPGAATLVDVRGALEGIRVEAGGATGTGVVASCAAGGFPTLRHVAVAGGGTLDVDGTVTAGLAQGVAVVTAPGGCGARLTGVQVTGVAGPALTIGPVDPAAATTVEVLGGSFGASNTGVWIRGGRVTLNTDPETAASVVASGNAWEGVVVGGQGDRLPFSTTAVEVALERVVIDGNGGTGLVLAELPLSPAQSRVRASGCDLHGNGAARPAQYGSASARRSAGGALVDLREMITEFTFGGNRLWSNQGDDLAFQSNASWSISPGVCGSSSNVFACAPGDCPGGHCSVATAGLGQVDAAYNVWPDLQVVPYYVTSAVKNTMTYCTGEEPGVPPIPSCP